MASRSAGVVDTDGFVDLRSDTVTRPTAEMRRAMADAPVGDDVYGEDPTINRLEEASAERFGREAALYCPTGTMCNQIALQLLAPPATEVLVESESHLVNYENGAGGVFSGAQFRTLVSERGQLSADQVVANIRPRKFPLTGTSVVWVEQTHNRRGGTCYTVQQLESLRKVTADAQVALYMDGARVFNAVVAMGQDPKVYGGLVDLLSFCTSKGLGAPVGSLLVGDADVIAQARGWRQRFGGGMRQAGVVAAASLVALDQMVDRLADDHRHARRLAHVAHQAHPDGVDLDLVETNIVMIEQVDAAKVVAELKANGVLVNAMDARTVRLVTHPDVDDQGVERAVTALDKILR